MKTISTILNKEFNFSVNHLGLFVTEDLHLQDKYIISIEGQMFDYSQGIGFRVENMTYNKKEFLRIKNMNPKQTRENLEIYASQLKAVSKPKPVKLDDVLYCIILDANCVRYNDFEDFCSEFGYDEDSIKANETYKECQKSLKKVKKFITNLDEATELFQEY